MIFQKSQDILPFCKQPDLLYRRFYVAFENENHKCDQTGDQYLELATILVNNLLAKPDVL